MKKLHGIAQIRDEEILSLGTSNLSGKSVEKKIDFQYENKIENIMKNIDLQHLLPEYQLLIKNIIEKYEDTFWLEGEKLGKCEIEHHEINLTDTIPVYVKQYPIPYKQRENAEIEALKLIKGKMVRHSTSPYNAPVFLVDKKAINGIKRKRMVVDYRGLNKKTLNDPYCLPNITEIFDEIGKNRYYTAIDISQGFYR